MVNKARDGGVPISPVEVEAGKNARSLAAAPGNVEDDGPPPTESGTFGCWPGPKAAAVTACELWTDVGDPLGVGYRVAVEPPGGRARVTAAFDPEVTATLDLTIRVTSPL